ncbi:MAG: flavodoxin domain-containing protein [bacterium]
MEPVQIKDNVYWVGAVDWNVRNFHGYSTHLGTTYNAYLAVDEKITLFDTVKSGFGDELVYKIERIVDPRKVNYLIVNHVEPDHSGCIPEIVDLIQPEKIFCSPMGKEALLQHFHREDWPYEVVKTGDEISIGKKSVHFMETRMLHWPDSMFSYIPEDRLLISQDGFGQHWATGERFDDEVDKSNLFNQTAKYYANIVMPYAGRVKSILKDIHEKGFAFDMIAPDHGLIWRRFTNEVLEAYEGWSQSEAEEKALVVYDSMWHSTERMAKAVIDGLLLEGLTVHPFDLKVNNADDIMTEVLDSKAVVFGSPTLNNGVMPPMAAMLSYMKGLRPTGKIGAAFGSYGWSGEAVRLINQAMEEMKFDIIDPGIRVKYVPTEDDLKQCVELGQKIGRAVKEKS